MLIMIPLVCFYVGCVAFWVIGVLRAPYGFQDEKGFHVVDAPAPAPQQNRPVQEARPKRKTAVPFRLGYSPSNWRRGTKQLVHRAETSPIQGDRPSSVATMSMS